MRTAHTFSSPLGELLALLDENGALLRLEFLDGRMPHQVLRDAVGVRWDASAGLEVETQLGEYFRGTRREFSLRVAPEGTAFQREVWSALQRIPYGATLSYGVLAERLGNPKAVRAVGR
ncbi:MAG: methylated-DNA--[protein]-cysteine S-methyltransferase, partial [Myxococcota bacterium]